MKKALSVIICAILLCGWTLASAQEQSAANLLELGERYYTGNGVEQSDEKAAELIRQAADLGDKDAQRIIGYFYFSGTGTEQSYDKAAEYFRLAAEQGDAGARFYLGIMYENGLGVKASYAQAIDMYTLAAEQGLADAQNALGLMYEDAYGVEQSYEEAVKYFSMAAGQGSAVGQYNLGRMYYEGSGVEQSYENALDLFIQAARQDHPQAMEKIATMYYRGILFEQSYANAAELYTYAAELGDTVSQRRLGDMYSVGLGVDQSDEKAAEMYSLADAESKTKPIIMCTPDSKYETVDPFDYESHYFDILDDDGFIIAAVTRDYGYIYNYNRMQLRQHNLRPDQYRQMAACLIRDAMLGGKISAAFLNRPLSDETGGGTGIFVGKDLVVITTEKEAGYFRVKEADADDKNEKQNPELVQSWCELAGSVITTRINLGYSEKERDLSSENYAFFPGGDYCCCIAFGALSGDYIWLNESMDDGMTLDTVLRWINAQNTMRLLIEDYEKGGYLPDYEDGVTVVFNELDNTRSVVLNDYSDSVIVRFNEGTDPEALIGYIVASIRLLGYERAHFKIHIRFITSDEDMPAEIRIGENTYEFIRTPDDADLEAFLSYPDQLGIKTSDLYFYER